jgi:Alpha/beta hydrolase of unknown function (DUF900)
MDSTNDARSRRAEDVRNRRAKSTRFLASVLLLAALTSAGCSSAGFSVASQGALPGRSALTPVMGTGTLLAGAPLSADSLSGAVPVVDVNNTVDDLVEISAGDHPRRAIILIGGIDDTFHYWDPWLNTLARQDTIVFGYNHDHRRSTMPAASSALAARTGELKVRGITEVVMIAHSMGGLVAKGALQNMSREGRLADFQHIELHAFGTPWGGFAAADSAVYMPGAAVISKLIGYPMGPDIGPASAYMKSLGRPLPANVGFYVYVGREDSVALPITNVAWACYTADTAGANRVTVLDGYHHTDYTHYTWPGTNLASITP